MTLATDRMSKRRLEWRSNSSAVVATLFIWPDVRFLLGASTTFKPLLMPCRKELDSNERETAGEAEDREQEAMRMKARTQADGKKEKQ